MVARVLQQSGLYLGEEQELAAAKPDNPDGFFEHLKFVDLNEEILGALGGGWDLPPTFPHGWQVQEPFPRLRAKAELLVGDFRGREPWGWKDPRNSITMPFWREVLPQLRVVICVRNPLEVAMSLRTRNFFSYEMALSLWSAYHRRVLEAAPREQRLVVHYDAFFRRPEAELRRALDFAGISATSAVIAEAIQFIRPQLRHNSFDTRNLLDVNLSPDTVRMYLALSAEAGWLNGARELAHKYESVAAPSHLLSDGEAESVDVDVAQFPEPIRVSAGKLDRNALDLELLRRQIAPTREELERRASRIRELEGEVAPAREELDRRGSRITELESELGPARDELQRREEEIRDLQSQLIPAREELQRQLALIQELQLRQAETHQGSEDDFQILANEREQIQKELVQSSQAVSRLQSGIRNLESELTATQQQADRLEKLLEEKEMALLAAAEKSVALAELHNRTANQLSNTERQRDFYRQATAAAQRDVQALVEQLGSIHRSRLWKAGASYWKLLQWLGRLPRREGVATQASVWVNGGAVFDLPVPPASEKESGPEPKPEPQVARDTPEIRPVSEGGVKGLVRKLRADRPPEKGVVDAMSTFVQDFERRYERRPSILDWGTGANLSAALPHDVVFSPSIESDNLAYVDRSVDVVCLPASESHRFNEARRVARYCVVTTLRSPGTFNGDPQFSRDVQWLGSDLLKPLCASIIIPVFNNVAITAACLDALDATLSSHFCGEIIIVDDASTDGTAAELKRRAEADPRLRVITNERNMGFIDSCNRAAAEASHDFLVFLNNDTIPQPGWLSALLTTFHRHRDAGAVGGKLLFPDGTLQEAGGRLFSDATGINFGKGDPEPDAPLFSYVREVDYCSGALLATRRTLFNEIGGFDTQYRPAYYEDADYCFQVRKKGLRVLFQPESRVIHLEGATSGRDLHSGAKKHQVANREKFQSKWESVLAKHPAPPQAIDHRLLLELSGMRGARNVLVINHTVPEYDREGGSRRLWHLLEFLKEEGWNVSFMAPWVPWGERYERELQQMGIATYRKGLLELKDSEYKTEAERLIAMGDFDIAIIAFWHIAEIWAPQVRKLSPRTKIVVDSVDLHFLRQARGLLRSADGRPAQLNDSYADQMKRELNLYASSDAVLTVSEKEAAIVNDFSSNPRLAFAVPESEAPMENLPAFAERSGILFIGSFRHPPNIEAVTFLVTQILPLVNRRLFDEHPVYIVGTGFDERMAAICSAVPNVRMVGWVPSLDDYLRHARISVLPLLNGAGTKTKLIQALNAGIPSVSTHIGAEGLPIVHGQHVLIADQPEPFARAIETLLTDEALWGRLATNGKQRIEETHGRTVGRAKFAGVLSQLLEN